jgi:hypothetical protein
LPRQRREPENIVFGEAARWLERRTATGRAGVYELRDAFAAFVRGGGNVALYAATSERLRRVYAEYDSVALLDIGVGEGAALLPALSDPIGPSRGAQVALRWLASHTARLVLVEFDVPRFDDPHAPARVQDVVEWYSRGLAEYVEDRELVAQGFLMPMLFGSFDRTTARTNYEQPIESWTDDLRTTGFTHVASEHLYRYWWADAYLVDGRTDTTRDPLTTFATASSRPNTVRNVGGG